MKVRDLLTDSSKWTQGALARDASGEPCRPNGDIARQWCILGALTRIYGDTVDFVDATEALGQVIQNLDNYDDDDYVVGEDVDWYAVLEDEIWAWNDDPERSFSEVLEVLERANI
jgi:Fe-S-cluster formation regulator IscX/YfhJ